MKFCWTLVLLMTAFVAGLDAGEVLHRIKVVGETSTNPLHTIWLCAFVVLAFVPCAEKLGAKPNDWVVAGCNDALSRTMTSIMVSAYLWLSLVDGWPTYLLGQAAAYIVLLHLAIVYAVPNFIRLFNGRQLQPQR
ncbi:MAG: hypothetical protein HY975_02930 [Candidatus Kerfeldbacteria bacterium]|nr:hypothetical protein [Candidatus Kerfeldbacteria bacterium]